MKDKQITQQIVLTDFNPKGNEKVGVQKEI